MENKDIEIAKYSNRIVEINNQVNKLEQDISYCYWLHSGHNTCGVDINAVVTHPACDGETIIKINTTLDEMREPIKQLILVKALAKEKLLKEKVELSTYLKWLTNKRCY